MNPGINDVAVLFAVDLPVEVNQLLQSAVVVCRSNKHKAEALFKQALSLDPDCLYAYFALYKFYFHQAMFAEAETFACKGLNVAAEQAGFPSDYHQLYRDRENWNLYADQASLFYLYTLKALAFIKLRQGQTEQAEAILTIMLSLDPEDRSGFSVILDLAEALKEA